MNATETYQIQVDPDDASASAMLELAQYDEPMPRRTWVKLTMGKILHPFRIHTWVRWLHYDSTSKRVIQMNGVICCFCSKARLR